MARGCDWTAGHLAETVCRHVHRGLGVLRPRSRYPWSPGPGGAARRPEHRRLTCESLEARELLSGAGPVDVGSQPAGALAGKTVYVHGGHGWTYSSSSGTWSTQRPETYEMVEDFGNQDQMNFLVDYLFRAGATVVPLRPAGHQVHEVVLDNDDPGVTFSGNWNNSSSSTFFGTPGDVPYRWAGTASSETAHARYQPNLPVAGFYPVYAWTRPGSDRVSNQLYRIRHTGGITEVTVNHRRVGNGWVYLGNYYFAAGTSGYVDISNRSGDSGVVIADAIRFGNGMGDINAGGGVSGKPREDEAGLYWIQSQFGQGTNTAGISSTVSAPPRWAAQMNRAADGAMTDRLYFSFHSNAGGGSARGTFALYNGNNDATTATPHQLAYAQLVGREVNDDLVAMNGQFEHNWQNRTTVTLDRSDIEFGEINNHYINDEFDATIVEVAFHDNQQDAELMRDPQVRRAVARASYQGIVRYFHQFDGGATPLALLPDPVHNVRALAGGDGSVTIRWEPAGADGIGGDPATGYRVEKSLDGYGFDSGTYVDGGATTSYHITGLDPADGMVYFRVIAVNPGGASAPSPVVATRPTAGGHSTILIVDGFDRLGRSQNFRQPFGSGKTDRVRQRYANTHDYSVQVGEAVEAYPRSLGVDTVANEAISAGQVQLDDYNTVIWILGEESSADSTFDTVEQSKVIDFLTGGGNLFVSGAEIGWDLDWLNNGRLFYNVALKADYVADDAGTYNAQGVAGSIFDGLSLTFDNGSQFYDTDYPDVIAPLGGATAALTYAGGTGGVAAIQYEGAADAGRVVMLGFPFETIVDPATRAAVMTAALNLFNPPLLGDVNRDGQINGLDVGPFVSFVTAGGFQVEADMNGDGAVNGLDVQPFADAVVGGGGVTAVAEAATTRPYFDHPPVAKRTRHRSAPRLATRRPTTAVSARQPLSARDAAAVWAEPRAWLHHRWSAWLPRRR